MSHCDDCRRDCSVVRVRGDLADKGAVDLERVQRKMLQVAEGRVPGTEVVHGEVQPHGPERVKGLGAFLVVIHQHALRELQAEISWLKVAHLQGATNRFAQPPLQLSAGEVDTNSDAWESSVLPGAVLHAGRLKNPFTHRHNQTVLF